MSYPEMGVNDMEETFICISSIHGSCIILVCSRDKFRSEAGDVEGPVLVVAFLLCVVTVVWWYDVAPWDMVDSAAAVVEDMVRLDKDDGCCCCC